MPRTSRNSKVHATTGSKLLPFTRLGDLDPEKQRQRIKQLTMLQPKDWPRDTADIVGFNAASLIDDLLSRPQEWGYCSAKESRSGAFTLSRDDVESMLSHVFHAGFIQAMLMHRQELMSSVDAAVIVNGRRRGNVLGHASQSQRKHAKAKLIRDTWAAMEAAGERPTNGTVAARCGCSERTVIRAFDSRSSSQPAR
jgi:hypothetical protein